MTEIQAHAMSSMIAAIHHGIHAHIAAELAGIPRPVFTRWMYLGRRMRHGRFRDFYLQVEKARAEARAMVEKELRQQNPRDWLHYGPGKEDWSPWNRPDTEAQSPLAYLEFNRLLSRILKLLEPFPEARAVLRDAFRRKKSSTGERTCTATISTPPLAHSATAT